MSEEWTKEMLMGTINGGKPTDTKKQPALWGLPGHLTEEECEIYFKFRDEVEKRNGEFKNTIYSFGEVEGEVWALCRWLRARKFVYDDVIKMIEEATACRASARENGFYPDPVEALGCKVELYFAQYPQLYTGFAKNGAPIFISKPGLLDVDAVECLTTIDGIVKFHWYIMMHDFGSLLRKNKEKNPDFKRFECFCILDLDKLTTSKLSSRALAIIKEQSAIDSVCFPETMSKMFIVNAPIFFTATWRLIKGWLDPRTAGKIEMFSSKTKAIEKLKEFVDEDQLPSDYGGKGPDTEETLRGNIRGDATKIVTETLFVRGSSSVKIDVAAGQFLEVTVHTRSPVGGKFTLTNATDKSTIVQNVDVKHTGTDDPSEIPSAVQVTSDRIPGPCQVKVKADSYGSRFSSLNFLVVGAFFPTK